MSSSQDKNVINLSYELDKNAIILYDHQRGDSMNHNILKKIITDQHQIIQKSQIIRRPYSFEKNGNYVLTGLRRAGKSMLLYGLVLDLIAEGVEWNQIIYINFEDERLAEFSLSDFNDIVAVQSEMSDRKGYFFFDEIQIVQGWEKFARRMADNKERIYITGSNAKMLSREIETTLGGRFLEKFVTPYSFAEYLTARQISHQPRDLIGTKTRGRIDAAFLNYLEEGGLPESLLFNSKREYISTVLQKIVLGDIIARKSLKNDLLIQSFFAGLQNITQRHFDDMPAEVSDVLTSELVSLLDMLER